jgi:hypothetical protein
MSTGRKRYWQAIILLPTFSRRLNKWGLPITLPDCRLTRLMVVLLFGFFLDVHGFLGAAAGGNGIAPSGGIGRALAELAVGTAYSFEIQSFRLDRFGAIDPMSYVFQQQCAAARDHKTGG